MECIKCVLVGDGFVGKTALVGNHIAPKFEYYNIAKNNFVTLEWLRCYNSAWPYPVFSGALNNNECERYTPTIFDNTIVSVKYKDLWVNIG